jgi:hypothetical protein
LKRDSGGELKHHLEGRSWTRGIVSGAMEIILTWEVRSRSNAAKGAVQSYDAAGLKRIDSVWK